MIHTNMSSPPLSTSRYHVYGGGVNALYYRSRDINGVSKIIHTIKVNPLHLTSNKVSGLNVITVNNLPVQWGVPLSGMPVLISHIYDW